MHQHLQLEYVPQKNLIHFLEYFWDHLVHMKLYMASGLVHQFSTLRYNLDVKLCMQASFGLLSDVS